jgi:RNA polymerase sigma-70 factor, ECF subfamily
MASTALEPVPATVRRMLDAETRAWIDDLGAGREEALARLHGLLLRAARAELRRRNAELAALRIHDVEDLAVQTADDACIAVLKRLDDFRGESRFTTWAYKFALLEAAVKLRRRAWQGRELPTAPAGMNLFVDLGLGPDAALEQRELLDAVREGIERLTPHQRDVLVALALNGVPIDVLAERLATTRGALYKALHDARVNLRRQLAGAGLALS